VINRGTCSAMRARYYDATCGRFISQDSAKDGLNWFVYAKNNPFHYVDTSGDADISWSGTAQSAMYGLIIGFFAAVACYFAAGDDSPLKPSVIKLLAVAWLASFLARCFAQLFPGGRI
jgi:hypothetical protein